MKYIALKVKHFLEFKNDSNENFDPINPLVLTLTRDDAKEIDKYYLEIINIKNEEIRELKETIVRMAKEKK